MDLLFFGRLAEIAGSRGGEVDLPATVTTVGEVRAWLLRERPRVGEAIAAPGVFAVADNVVVRDDALPNAQTAMAGLTEYSPDWIRAQDINLVAEAKLSALNKKKRRQNLGLARHPTRR